MMRSRGVALLAACTTLMATGACGESEIPRIALATNLEYADAAALALSDAQSEWGALPADTILVLEAVTLAATAIRTASELAGTKGVVAVVGHSNSSSSLAAAPIYNESRIVQLSPQSSAVAYSDAGPFSYRLVPPDDRQGQFIADALNAMEGADRIVVLYVNDDYGRGLRSSLLAALGEDGPVVVAEVPHLEVSKVGVEDLELARRIVVEARPDVVVWLGRALVLEQYLPILLSAAPTAQIIGGDALAPIERHAEANPMWHDISFVDFVDVDGGDDMRDFRRRFEARYGRRVSSTDALTYDAMRLLLEAVREGATSGPAIRDYLDSLGRSRPAHAGITGPIRFDDNGDVSRSYVLRRVTGEDHRGGEAR